VERYAKLADFCRRHKLVEEYHFYDRSLEALKGDGPVPASTEESSQKP
jgi:hypothetical protein